MTGVLSHVHVNQLCMTFVYGWAPVMNYDNDGGLS